MVSCDDVDESPCWTRGPPAWHTAVNSPSPGDVDNTVNRIQAGIQVYDTVYGTAFWSRWAGVDDINGINHPDP